MTVPPAPGHGALERATTAFRRGALREALIEYDVVLGGLQAREAPALRGTALLGRALVSQLLGDRHAALGDAVAALDEWRLAPPDWVARALIGMAAALEAGSPAIAAEYWQVAGQLAGRGEDPRLPALLAGLRAARDLAAGATDSARAHLVEAERLARQAADDATAASALVNVARIDLDAGRRREAGRTIAEALSLAAAGPHVEAAAGVLLDLAAVAFADGGGAEAALYLEQVLVLGGSADPSVRERALTALAGIARDRGDLAEAMRLASQAMALWREAGDATAVVQAMHDVGVIALLAGDDGAEDQLIESMAGARRHGLPALAASLSRALALAASRRGDHLRALGYAEQAAEFAAGPADREACAATLARVAGEAERWHRFDLAITGHQGAAEIYAVLGRTEHEAAETTAVERARILAAADRERETSVQTGLELARKITATD